MSQNKETVATYIDGFRTTDHEKILSCITDNVVWDMPGNFHLQGKEAFDKEIENDLFEGKPTILIHRMTEENNVVVAEGVFKASLKQANCWMRFFVMCLKWKMVRLIS